METMLVVTDALPSTLTIVKGLSKLQKEPDETFKTNRQVFSSWLSNYCVDRMTGSHINILVALSISRPRSS